MDAEITDGRKHVPRFFLQAVVIAFLGFLLQNHQLGRAAFEPKFQPQLLKLSFIWDFLGGFFDVRSRSTHRAGQIVRNELHTN